MGDRANVAIETRSGEYVYIYTHWGGCELPADVQRALKRQQRWDDSDYLARVVFCEVCKDFKSETGYGISTAVGDSEHPILMLHPDRQTVTYHPFDSDKWEPLPKSNEWTFEEFCAITDIEWNKLEWIWPKD